MICLLIIIAETFCKAFGICDSFSSLVDDPRYTHFTEDYEYKGKSKVKIEDLFKMENE